MKERLGPLFLLVALVSCSGGSSGSADCWHHRADTYRQAAELARSTIQTNLPTMTRSVERMLRAEHARDPGELKAGFRAFQRASRSIERDGRTFSGYVGRARATCTT